MAANNYFPVKNGLIVKGGFVANDIQFSLGANLVVTTSLFRVGNTTANLQINSISLSLINATASANLAPGLLTIGTSVVNTSVIAAGANVLLGTTTLNVGPNVYLSTANLSIGNSTVNLFSNSVVLMISNSTQGVFGNTSGVGGTTTGKDFAIYANNVVKITVGANSFVGIGNTTPADFLHVQGNVFAVGNVTSNGYKVGALTVIDSVGKINAIAANTTVAPINIPHGTAPSSPTNGDLWTTTAGLYSRINGTTIGPFAAGGAANVQTFTSSGTWTKPNTGTFVLIECWGGGGGGSKLTGSAGFGSSGGGGGGYMYRHCLLSDLGATETVTVGAGGTGSSSNNVAGSNGGSTTFGSLITAYGGVGGTVGGVGGQGAGWFGSNGFYGYTTGVFNWGAGAIGDSTGCSAGRVNAAAGFLYGGGGGASGGPTAGVGAGGGVGGHALYGGGGGGAANATATIAVGVSQFGGNGGAGSVASSGQDGYQPAGGGGGTTTGTKAGNGAPGMVRVIVF